MLRTLVCVSKINCRYAFLCSQGPVEDRCDSSRPSEENPQQHSVHAPAGVSVPDGHCAGMTTGGAWRRAGQLAEELPAGEPNPIGARQNRDYHPDLRTCFRRRTIIPYPTDKYPIRTVPDPLELPGRLLTCRLFVSLSYIYRENWRSRLFLSSFRHRNSALVIFTMLFQFWDISHHFLQGCIVLLFFHYKPSFATASHLHYLSILVWLTLPKDMLYACVPSPGRTSVNDVYL